ncbi:hypothetical protein N7474_004654 [Penicillium riverlandense]|uniref:uncharacterized protein n=1 Tax=Penicillium riverlandense TaxID=1903569 RepID=UPI002546901F|nr:uncharacterized protein N7474_004654 [Penicillium riverlandense]KAJ5819063.1 hypothetical protein N7474_004654 [Penicillium riverlandense]
MGPPVPATGLQALILCGPGVSLNTFTSNPEENPKGLVQIANRPQIFYPIEWCKKMGITSITLISPPAAVPALEAALSQNPHLTSLPSPSPSVLAPADLEMVTGTAELLRLPEVQACIKSDFLLLPCDLICEIPGISFLETWMLEGRRSGLSVFYPTQGREESIKKEAADFVCMAPLEGDEIDIRSERGLSKLVLSMPMDTLKEKMEEDKALLIRHSLVKRHAQVKMLTSYRDAHIYVFPYWVKDFARLNEKFQSVSEDLVGWWAKSEWQTGLGEKLKMNEIFQQESHSSAVGENGSDDGDIEQEISLTNMSTTKTGTTDISSENPLAYASRVKAPGSEAKSELTVPPMLAYIHSSLSSAPLVRRIDSSAILLSTSLRLAKLEAIEEVGRAAASPFAFNTKIAETANVAQKSTVTKSDCLVGENTTIEERCVIKESVIGANCKISMGARLQRCVLMDGAVVGPRAQLTGCVLGKRSNVGRECVLKDSEVQHGNSIPDETEAKNEKFMIFEGMDEDGMDVSGDFDDGQDVGF